MLLIRYTENYPEVIKLKAEIEALKRQQAEPPDKNENSTEPEMSTMNPIYQQLKQTLLQTEAEIDALDAKKRQFAVLTGQKEAELRSMPEGKKILSDLEKERDSYNRIYEQLLGKVGQSDVSKQMEIEDKATTFRIVDPAILPIKPVSPNRIKIILLGLFFGVVGGFGGVILREAFDSSVKDLQTLRSFGVEILAVIPRIFNEEENMRKAKKDKLVYTIAGSYMLIICILLIHEIMGLTLIDSLLDHLRS